MDRWRPDNWVNKYGKEEWHTDVEWTRRDVAIGFEAGADAMLEALLKYQVKMPPDFRPTLIVIPSEE